MTGKELWCPFQMFPIDIVYKWTTPVSAPFGIIYIQNDLPVGLEQKVTLSMCAGLSPLINILTVVLRESFEIWLLSEWYNYVTWVWYCPLYFRVAYQPQHTPNSYICTEFCCNPQGHCVTKVGYPLESSVICYLKYQYASVYIVGCCPTPVCSLSVLIYIVV